MKTIYSHLLPLLLAVCFLAAPIQSATYAEPSRAENIPAVINYVSTDRYTQNDAFRSGSLAGDVDLFIRGAGLPNDIRTVQILIDGQDCPINLGLSSPIQLACTVPAARTAGKQKIVVVVHDKVSVISTCPTSLCYYIYSETYTPVLQYIVPTATTPSNAFKMAAIPRVAKTSLVQFTLNSFTANSDVFGDQALSANDLTFAKYQIDSVPAGYYTADMRSVGQGKAMRAGTLSLSPGADRRAYDFCIAPEITRLSSNSGPSNGEDIVITGKGFKNGANEIEFEGTPCVIVPGKETATSITCTLTKPGMPAQNVSRAGHGGITQRRFSTKSTLADLKRTTEFINGGGSTSKFPAFEILYNDRDDFSQALEGLFKATVTGKHRFMLSASNAAELYISETPLSKANLVKIAEVTTGSNLRLFYDPYENGQISREIDLVAGEYYYLQAIHLATGLEHLTVGVRIPGSEVSPFNPKEVIGIKISADTVRLETILTIRKTTDNLQLIYNSGGTKTSSTFKYPSTKANIVTYLSQLGIEAEVLDQQYLNFDREVVSSSQAIQVTYRLKFYTKPNLATLPGLTNPANGGMVRASDVTPTDLVSGSYQIALGDNIVTLAHDATATDVQNAFNDALGERFACRVVRYDKCDDGCQYIVYFNTVYNLAHARLVSNALTGGKTNVVGIDITVLQDSTSRDLVYAPIPPDMLRTFEMYPQITVKTNGILATCPGNCRYQPVVVPNCAAATGWSLNGSLLTIEFTGAPNKALRDFTSIKFAGSTCTGLSYDTAGQTLVCSLPLNKNLTPKLVAGIHKPELRVTGCGIVNIPAAVPGILINPVIESIEGFEIGAGFMQFEATGTGFGFGMSCTCDRYGTKVTIGGVDCRLVELSNNNIVCETVRKVTEGPFTVTVNGISTDYPFTFQTPEITTYISGDCHVDIVGNLFDGRVNVKLENHRTGEFERCRKCFANETIIRCATCGYAPGDYTAVLTYMGQPTWRAEADFKVVYEVYSVYPAQGSLLGGTVLTLTGKGFDETLNKNQVSVGCEDGCRNLRCNIISATITELKCQLNPIDKDDRGLDGEQNVFPMIGLEFNADCATGVCKFTFTENATPKITSVSKLSINAGDEITFQGSLFSSTAQFTFEGLLAEIVGTPTSTSITVRVPKIPAKSSITFTANDPAYGNYDLTGATLTFSSELTFTDYNPKSGSVTGTYITITGTGFSDIAQVTLGTASPNVCEIQSLNSTQIVCKTPAWSSVRANPVTITQDGVKKTCTGCASFNAVSSGMPRTTSITPSTVGDDFKLVIVGTTLSSVTSVTLLSAKIRQQLVVTSNTASKIEAKIAKPIPGAYTLEVRYGNNVAYSTISLAVKVEFPQASVPANSVVSQAGGENLMLSFTGVTLPQTAGTMSVSLAGWDCPISYIDTSFLLCSVPRLVIPKVKDLGQETILNIGNPSIGSTNGNVAFDGNTATAFTGGSACYLGVDVGEGMVAQLNQVQFFPKAQLEVAKLRGSVIQGSMTENSGYETLATLSESIYEGWNSIEINSPNNYRYYRWFQATASSRCELAELVFKGIKMTNIDAADETSVVIQKASVTINGVTAQVTANVEYREDITPIIEYIEPRYGSSAGGTLLTISGTGLSNGEEDVFVYIDGVECTVETVAYGEVTCKTGELPDVSQRTARLNGVISLVVSGVGAAKITNGASFMYAERWTDVRTWGCDGLPLAGDSVHVPIGMNLLVDTCVPELNAVVVEGGLIFEDTPEVYEFSCKYLLIRNGLMRIGTEEEPFLNKLTITIRGEREDEQLPIFGNKAIAVYEGLVDIHGAPKAILHTKLSQTVAVGAYDIVVDDPESFEAGDEIVISSTSNNPTQNEKRTVICKLDNTLTLDWPLEYEHLSEFEKVKPDASSAEVTIEVKAIVALLSRTVTIQGDQDYSEENKYGFHMMFYDPGTQNTKVRISYTEIRFAGQAGYVDRHPINFQNNGDMRGSYITGCAVHSTYHRGIQVKGTSFVKVNKNVLYNTENEAIALPDGSERNNVIEDNVVIHVVASLFRFNSYRDPAAIRIGNPLNYVRRNKIAGVVNNGFSLIFSSYSSGGSSSKNICPQGEQLGAFEDNSVLSAGSVGLFIDSHYPRSFACKGYRENLVPNPFVNNLPLPAVYKNFVSTRTVIGFRAWRLGSVTFDSFTISDSSSYGIEVRHAQYAPINSTIMSNGLIVGSLILPQGSLTLGTVYGIVVPSDDGFTVDNVAFVRFGATSAALQGCSNCANAWEDVGSRVTLTKRLKFKDVTKRISYTVPYTHIFRDCDSTLTGLTGGGTAVYNWPHLRVASSCNSVDMLAGLACKNTVEVRGFNFWQMNPGFMREKQMAILRREVGDNAPAALRSQFSYLSYRYNKYGYTAPFLTGQAYQICVDLNLDFDSLLFENSPFSGINDKPITIVFNYTEPREVFEVTRRLYYNNNNKLANLSNLYSIFDNAAVGNLNFADYYNHVEGNEMLFTVTGKELGYQVLDTPDVPRAQIIARRCVTNCPIAQTIVCPDEGINWSAASTWPNGTLPVDNGDVLIPAGVKVILNINSPQLRTVEIQGCLEILDRPGSTITLSAKKIWVRGKLMAGTFGAGYQNNAVINLLGNRADTPLVVNYAVDAGTKAIVVTGELSLYGKPVEHFVRLAENANAGTDRIRIVHPTGGDISDFAIGARLLIAPSQENIGEAEERVITNFQDGYLILNETLRYFHYGADAFTGPVDMRTEVLLMTRNIRIQGSSEDGLGARILATDEYGGENGANSGKIYLSYVAMDFIGQRSTDRAGLTFEVTSNVTGERSLITNSVFTNSVGFAVRFQQAMKVTFQRNIIYNTHHYGIKFTTENQDISILDNIIVGVTSGERGPIVDLINFSAGIAMYDQNFKNVRIERNIVAGAGFASYLIIAPNCTSVGSTCGGDNYFLRNIAHSGQYGYIAYRDLSECVVISYFNAYRMKYGIISYFRINEVKACNLYLADNTYSLNLGSSSDGQRKFTVSDSTFVGVSDLNCPTGNCYSVPTCSNRAALALGIFTNDTRPDKFQFHRSTRSSVLGDSYTLKDNTFENFQDAFKPGCSNNKILSWSQYSADFIPYLSTSGNTLRNSLNRNPLSLFREPPRDDYNCGPEVQCTLVKNTVVRDTDGSFMTITSNPQFGTLFPNNEGVANYQATYNDKIKGFEKEGLKYALLGFKNLDSDKSLIVLDPIEITKINDDGFINKINSHRNNNPRHGGDLQKWISIIEPDQEYNLAFPKDIPVKLQFELQGETTDYAIVKIQYNSKKVVAITRNGAPVEPCLVRPGEAANLHSYPCGTYIFDREAGTIQFKITGEETCKLVVEQTNSLVANIRFDITVDEFYDQGGVAPFIDKVAAVLNIPSARIRIVSIYKGSVGIVFAIDADVQGENSMEGSREQLATYSTELQTAVEAGQLNVYNASILSYTQRTVFAETPEGTTNPEENKSEFEAILSGTNMIYVIVGVSVGVGVLIMGTAFFCYKRRKAAKIGRSVVKIAPAPIAIKEVETTFPVENPATIEKKREFAVAESRKHLAANAGSIESFGTIDRETPSNKDTKKNQLESIPEQPKRRMSIEEKIEDLSQ